MAAFDASFKKELDYLRKENYILKEQLLPPQKTAFDLHMQIDQLRENYNGIYSSCENAAAELRALTYGVNTRKNELIQLDDEILFQSFGLYHPIYDFATSDQYKLRLEFVRNAQKEIIRLDKACDYFDGWAVDGSKAKGKKLTKDNVKQILRTFNVECENAIDRVKFSNVDSMRKRIQKAYIDLNKLNETNQILITKEYFNLKNDELNLAVEYARKKQQEKEEARLAREEIREQQKLDSEIIAVREKITKEKLHFNKAIDEINYRLLLATDDDKQALLEKLKELQNGLQSLSEREREVDYREQNAKAGYVYIISNIGSFGENVHKIGMTRRLEPMDRISELGDASVPFKFDVHALIFSDDAPRLETALHRAFEDRKVNMVNGRKEFYRVTLEEIKKVVKENFDKSVDFYNTAIAEEFRVTASMLRE